MNMIKNFLKQSRVKWIIFWIFCVLFILIPLLHSVFSYNHRFPDISRVDLIQFSTEDIQYVEYNHNTGLYESIWYAHIIFVLTIPAFFVKSLIFTIAFLLMAPLLMLGVASIDPDKFILYETIFAYFIVMIVSYIVAAVITRLFSYLRKQRQTTD